MHAIGAACVFAKIPVAPIYYVKRADGNRCGVFEEDPLENTRVLPHYNLLYVTAREYQYSAAEFGRLQRGLAEVIPNKWTPHFMWHVAIAAKPKGAEQTYFELALATYQKIMGRLRSEPKEGKSFRQMRVQTSA
ncbi:hypothetical protein [Wenzhouxiangella sp. XN24]|uniref:hypothetical protein n=1 Tax=Wenzhouxiangella sp. XN24 TaxID=2713569 RepID=UPI0013EB563A|nr:hypothetical protein [Wenzhouxiangella sp. XN24]NGX16158.1 hypothetical protein [Wenzhouxiangella sp. XN24]